MCRVISETTAYLQILKSGIAAHRQSYYIMLKRKEYLHTLYEQFRFQPVCDKCKAEENFLHYSYYNEGFLNVTFLFKW